MEIKTIKTAWSPTDLKHNTYIIEEDNNCIIIDAGAPLEEVKKVTDAKILAMFITHGHFDHIQYIEQYDKLNIPIYVNEKTLDFFNDPKKNVSSLFNTNLTYNVKNVKIVKDSDIIKVLCKSVKCIETPGHSEDGMCYLIENELFSGDTLFSIAIGRTDLETASEKQMIESLQKLDKLDYNGLYSGHGRISNKEEQNSKIDYWINLLSEKDKQI